MSFRSFHSRVGNFAERRRQQRRKQKISSRQHLLQQLEDRRLLAGPELTAIRPDAGALLLEGDTLTVAPGEFNLLFKGGANIDESSITADSIKLVRAGGDGSFAENNEVDVALGYVGLADPGDNDPANLNRIVFRPSSSASHNSVDPANSFPDDLYQIQIIGAGGNALTDLSGDAFNDGIDLTTSFRLDRGAQVVSVVPQPISQGPLSQASDEIVVYFDDQPLDAGQAEDPKFYRLVDTANSLGSDDDRTALPETVTYDALNNKAVLKFASDLPEGTYRLDVGLSSDDDGTGIEVGTLLNGNIFAQSGFLGDINGVSNDADDVDVYNVQLLAGATLTVDLSPQSPALNLRARLLENGVERANVVATGAMATLNFGVTTSGAYVIEITSDNDATGSYLIAARVTGSPLSVDDDNSTIGTATNLGQLGSTTVRVSSPNISISNQGIALPPRAGSEDEPGHRQIQREQHIGATGTNPTAPAPITERQYNFPASVTNSQGDSYVNLITEVEKQIVREIYEIYAQESGFEFVESLNGGGTDIVKGDLRAANPAIGPNDGVAGLGGAGLVVLNGAIFDQANRSYGDGFTDVMFHEIGHSLGLSHSYDQPSNMGAPGSLPNDVLPGDHDIVHLQRIKPSNSTDIDMYRFEVTEAGRLQVETIAERLATPSLLNTALQLYRQEGASIELVAQNDQYFGSDSFIDLNLEPGTYFIGVTSTGNTSYDPQVPDSGYGGTTDGDYDLQIAFEATDPNDSLRDIDGTAFDGDADGIPGGAHSFWFQASDEATSIYVDKTNDLEPDLVEGTGSLADPYDNIATALRQAGTRIVVPVDGPTSIANGEEFTIDDGVNSETFRFGTTGANPVDIGGALDASAIATAIETAINASGLAGTVSVTVTGRVVQITGIDNLDLSDSATLLETPNLVRIVGNGGSDGQLDTLANNRPYLIGLDAGGTPLDDGAEFLVPQGVTVMIHEGTLLKLRKANLDAGSSAVTLSRSQSSIQVLGTPENSVFLRSYNDDSVGGDTNGAGASAGSGDFGGIVFRDDSDMEASGIFLNHVNHADIKHGGGKVFVGAQESVFTPLHIIDARPTVSFNHILSSDNAAISASPNSFEETNGRIGPDVNANFLVDNTINGMFIRVQTPLGSTVDKLTVSGRFDDTDITHILTENLIIAGAAGGPIRDGGNLIARAAGRLMIDPGTVLKLSGARIEAERGAGTIIAEGTVDRPIVFTSLNDDRFGGSGSFDSNSFPNSVSQGGDWGGLYFGQATFGSIDNAIIAFGGGSTPIEGGAANFNAVEVHQADLRIANTLLQSNASGNSGGTRNGRGANAAAAIYVRGAQPIIVDNVITDNAGAAISINANSLKFEGLRDTGRSTGEADRYTQLADNHGPLVRLNRLENNGTNGMDVRGELMTTEGIWDDTDIVHVLRSEITVGNHHTFSGVTLQSSNVESLVVKLSGNNAGFTATGTPVEIIDRIGGTIHVLGTVGHPVVLTHIADDTVGAGYTPSGEVMFNTNNSNNPSTGTSGLWRGFRFDEFSNDRNVAIVRELENPLTNGSDVNSTPFVSQLVGTLAPDQKSGDENRRLGFEVTGFISPNDAKDVDVYSFSATAGTGVWIDVDRTDTALDAIVEVVNSNGTVLARSMRSGDPAAAGTFNAGDLEQNSVLGGDHYTQNFRDPGLFYVLPGTAGQSGTYFVRIRSNPASSGVTAIAGESRGEYTMQIRLDQVQEFPGSTVKFADIRFAQTGIDVRGLPAHSPLIGEAGELADNNDSSATPQVLVNLLETDVAALGLSGSLSSDTDVDFYQFDLEQTGVQVISGVNDSSGTIAVVFDIDYSDNAVRGDTTIAVYDEDLRLIYSGRESNVQDDQPTSADGSIDDLGRGSLGKKDPYVGPIHLTPGGSYYVAVMSNRQLPSALTGVFQAVPANVANTLVRLEPVNSVVRVVEDHIGTQGYDSNGTVITPTTPAGLFDITTGVVLSGAGVDAHVTPLTLQDVALYLATDTAGGDGNDRLYTADPFANNAIRTRVSNDLVNGGDDIQDITIRSDGRMFGYQRLDGVTNSVGALVELDPATGAIIAGSVQNDNILGRVATPNVSALNANLGGRTARAEHFTTSDEVDALAFERLGTTGPASAPVPEYDVYYSVRESDSSSKLYRARENGDASSAIAGGGNQRYGFLGDIQPTTVSNASLTLSVSNNADPVVTTRIRIESKLPGTAGNLLNVNITRPNNTAATVTSVNFNTINLAIGGTGGPPLTAAPTAQAIVDAINSNAAARALVTAVIIDNGNGGDGTNGTVALNVFGGGSLAGGAGTPLNGRVTGLSFGNFNSTGNLFGVTSAGEFIEINEDNGNVVGTPVVIPGVSFSGLTLGPQNVEGGVYRDLLFATTTTGQIVAFDSNGVLQSIFAGGASSAQVSGFTGNPVGLAFSPLDFNLWHPTDKRGDEAGHGINEAPDGTREAVEGDTSFHFGFEEFTLNPGDDAYLSYNGVNAQYGVLTSAYQSDLSSNPDIANTYNLPGGGFGSLTTNTFSLAGSSEDDRPTLYFNYFLETENDNGSTIESDVNDPFRDSARVFVSRDGGINWELVATNNSQLSADDTTDVPGTAELPGFLSHLSDAGQNSTARRAESQQIVQELFDNTDGWRQARVDLSSFANEPNLMLRVDFSTAGTLADGTAGNFGELTSTQRSIRSLSNEFEGFYIDDILVGYAERGEMVTGAPIDGNVTDLNAGRTQNNDPAALADILQGAYQLEVRRTDEYITETMDGPVVTSTFDTNARHTQEESTTGLLADRNRERAQGIFILDSNYVTDSSVVGINVQPGTTEAAGNVPHPGSTINFPQVNQERLVPGIVIQNNVVAGSSGIRFAGETSASPQRPVPFGRIVNNTLVGDNRTGVGIEVVGLASPTLLNNVLTDLNRGITITNGNGTVVRSNFFQNNVGNGTVGTDSIIAAASDPLFLDEASRNYILAPTSLAVDSSQNTEQDRLDFQNFKNELGIPASPINAPDRDIFGQLRVDSNAGPGGGGSEVFKDRGATDRSDSDSPFAVLLNPFDNDSQDRDPADTIVLPTDSILENFTILLSDSTGVDSLTVDDPADPSVSEMAIRIEENREPLVQGADYTVGYNELTGVLLLTPLSTLWNQTSVYTITLDNTLISDRAGNLLRANQNDGMTRFTIVMPDAPLDFGDAPDSYDTLLNDDGARHAFGVTDSPTLGSEIDEEEDGQPTVAADGDDLASDDEDGVPVGSFVGTATTEGVFLSGTTGTTTDPGEVIAFLNRSDDDGAIVPITVTGDSILDAWVDFNADGDFADAGEHVLVGVNVTDGVNSLRITTPATASVGATYARFRLSIDGVDSFDSLEIGGEVEDYRVTIFDVDDPVINDDQYTVAEDGELVVDGLPASQPTLFDNDVLPTDEFVQSKYTIDAPLIPHPTDTLYRTTNGMVRVDDPLAGLFTYTPDPDFYGTDSFRYIVRTQENGSVAYTGTANIDVTPVNDAPGVTNAALRTIEDIQDVSPDGGFLIDATVLLAAAIADADPQTTLVPQDESNQQVFLQSVTTNFGTLDDANRGMIDGEYGTLSATFDANGNILTLLYVPAADFNSENLPANIGDFLEDVFTFTVVDDGISAPVDGVTAPDNPLTATATAGIRVTPQNDTPVLVTDNVSITDPAGPYSTYYTDLGLEVVTPTEDVTLTIPSAFLLGNDEEGPVSAQDEQTQFNGNDGPLSIIDVTLDDPTLGAISVDPSGDVVFVPADDIFGEVIFTYTVIDQGINQDSILVSGAPSPKVDAPLQQTVTSTIFIEPVNDAPVAISRTFDVEEVVETRAPDAPLPIATITITKSDLLTGSIADLQNPTLNATPSDIPLAAPFNEDNQVLEITSITVNGVTTSTTETLATASGGELAVEFDANGNFVTATYTPGTDYNANSANDLFSYVVTDDGEHEFPVGTPLTPDTAPLSTTATVTLVVNPNNDLPVFDIPGVVDILERDDSQLTRIDGFFTNVFGAPATATDEQGQGVAFTISLVSLSTPNLMNGLPDVSTGSSIDFFPNPDEFGTAVYEVTATDDGDPNRAFAQTFTINVRPVNDAPRFDPTVAGTSAADPNDANLGFSVANVDNEADGEIDDATITYTLWEDNFPTPSDTAPVYFIPLDANGSYPVGLLDVFTVGPANELSAEPGGSQVISLLSFGNAGTEITTDQGGTLTLVPGGLEYRPAIDYNTAINGVDSFVYTVIDDSTTGGETYDLDLASLIDDQLTTSNTVILNVMPVNDPPVYDIPAEVEILERDDSQPTRITSFITNVAGARATALDEQGQTVAFTIALQSGTPGLMTRDPDVTSGSFVDFFPAPDAFGSATYVLTGTDNGVPNEALSQTFTIDVQPVNDAPRFDPTVAGTSAADPNDANLGFSVANVDNEADGEIDDATITYTLWEDNSPTPSDAAPVYFIPLDANGAYPVGLLDVFTVGPANELSAEPGGSQVISLLSFGNAGAEITTDQGGTLTLVAGGLEYRPAIDYNTAINGVDSFTYTVIDDSTTGGETYDLTLASLIDDQLTTDNTVILNVMPVNDPPVYDIPAEVEILERDDSQPTRIDNFITNVAGARATALDEQGQSVVFTIALQSGTPGLMTRDPDVTSGSFVDFFPAPDAFGSATYVLTGTDNGVPNEALTQTFTIDVQPVNDAPRFDPTVAGTSDSQDADTAYSVARVDFNVDGQIDDATITYTLREDNTQRFGDTSAAYFIPLTAGAPTGGYQQVGLLDVFTVGPANEASPVPGGSQELELLSFGNPPTGVGVDFTSSLGGILRPVFSGSTLIGLSYKPPTNFNNVIGGFDSFTYTVRDDSTTGGETYSLLASSLVPDRLTATNSVRLNLLPVNDRPVFNTATTFIEVPEDSTQLDFNNYAFNINAAPQATAFDEVDINSGQSVFFSILPQDFPLADANDFFSEFPTINRDTGLLSFQPAANVFGRFDFEISLVDNGAGSADGDNSRGDLNTSVPVTLTIDVQPTNDPPRVDPTSQPLHFTLLEDGSVDILVTGDNTSRGLLDVFLPGPSNESDDILPEVGGNQTVSLGTPTPATSADGGDIQPVFDPITGEVTRLIYTPRANFVGMDSFIYTVVDDGSSVSVGTGDRPFSDPRIASNTVTFEVFPVNDAPQFSGAANVASDEDQGLVVIDSWANNVQAGPLSASDEINGSGLIPPQPLQFVFRQVSSNVGLFTTPPSAVINGNSASLVYETSPDANGTATFEVFLQDGGPRDASIGDMFSSPVTTFLIDVRSVNDAPTFSAGPSVTVNEDSGPYSEQWATGISPGPADESSQSVQFVVTTPPEFASLFLSEPVISDGGVLRFTPASNANTDNLLGSAQIQVTAIDSEGGQAQTVILPITINEVNDDPVAVADAIITDEDTLLTITSAQLLANDIDPDLDSNVNEFLTVVIPTESFSVAGARVTFDAVTGDILYDPTNATAIQSLPLGGSVVDSFSYSARDASGQVSGLVTVGLTVAGLNDAPILTDDDVDLNLDGPTIIRPLDNDTDVDGTINVNSIVITLQPAFGSLTPQPDGSLVYTPFVSFTVEDQFRYTVVDDLGERSAEALVTISANASPIAVDDARGTFLDEAVDIDVVLNDSDPDGFLDLGSIVIVTQPTRGEAIPQPGGIVQYLPDPGFLGRDSFTYQIFDNEGRGSNIANVDTQVVASRLQNPDLAPDVNDDGFVTALDALLVINELSRADGVSSIPVLPTDRGPDFYDVNGSQAISALDAILVINELSRLNSGGISAEQVPVGESLETGTDLGVSQTQDSGPELVGDALKVVDTSPVTADVVDLIATERDSETDEDGAIAALDAAMADLL